ncbi:putative choline transporter, neither null mutation nor overexpression affects choline transport [Phlyctochytrium planicorne]|nr:putative choline transporter, neither null mutation nor overexpression affects choline transport [Phlyctochytrium planicorne]
METVGLEGKGGYEDTIHEESSNFLPSTTAPDLKHNPLQSLDEPPAVDDDEVIPARGESLPNGNWKVLHTASQRNKCHDWPFAILFVLVMGFGLAFGIRGVRKMADPASFCNLISPNALDSALPSSSNAGSFYDGCIHHIVSNDLRSARSECVVYAVNTLSGSTNSRRSLDASSLRHEVSRSLGYYSGHENTFERAAVQLPSIVQQTASACGVFLAAKVPNAASLCLRYGFSNLLGAANDTLGPVFDACVGPMVAGKAGAFATCADWVVSTSLNGAGKSISNAFSSCAQLDASTLSLPVSFGVAKDTVLDCVRKKMVDAGASSETIDSIQNGCVEPAISGTVKDSERVVGCLRIATSSVSQSKVPDAVNVLLDGCVLPLANGTTSALGLASKCAETVLDRALGGNQVFGLVKQTLLGGLGQQGVESFTEQCLIKTIGDFSANKGFDLTGCLFKGPNSIAIGIGSYFSSFRDRVSQSALKLAQTFLVVVIIGVLMATIINFVILNIPGGIILAVILVLKIGWYIWTWHHIRFAAKLLHISLKYLKRNPQVFFLASFLFIWNAGWCFIFACAYLDLYSPEILASGPSLGYFAIVLIILGFFWSYEVWKGVLGVSVAGAIGTWYYYKPDLGSANRAIPLQQISEPGRRNRLLLEKKKEHIQLRHPMVRSFIQAITFSFGTICFASLILASLKTFHYMYRRARNSRKPILRTIVLLLLSCIEWILKVFNLYALARVGVRHEGYCSAAKKTAEVLKVRGMEAVVNDDCVDKVMGGGRWVGAISVSVSGFIASKFVYKLDWDISFMVAIVSLLFGFSILSIMASTVEMSVVTLFVCLAENPEAMLLNHPLECATLAKIVRGRCIVMGWEVPEEIMALCRQTGVVEVDEDGVEKKGGNGGAVDAFRWLG